MTTAGFRLPDDSHRHTILGKTGTGKTQLAMWNLSMRKYMRRPWMILDFKGDELINSIDNAQHVEVGYVPRKPGVYICHPMPTDKAGGPVEELLWKMWAQENIGLYIDEGYMVGSDSEALRAILTQGRSKKIPAIVLSQRPVWMSRFAFSEADFIQYLYLNDVRDRKTVQSFIPTDINVRLPDYHSYYYDVGRDKLVIMKPVPDAETILAAFDENLGVRRKYI